MHDGKTFDDIIYDISPVVDRQGEEATLYVSSSAFQSLFIKGEDGTSGDEFSLAFVTDYLNVLAAISATEDRANEANGSILLDANADVRSPLDGSKEASSDFLKIVESNDYVASTVPSEAAATDAGKSSPDLYAEGTQQDEAYDAAAKQDDEQAVATEAVATEAATLELVEPEAEQDANADANADVALSQAA